MQIEPSSVAYGEGAQLGEDVHGRAGVGGGATAPGDRGDSPESRAPRRRQLRDAQPPTRLRRHGRLGECLLLPARASRHCEVVIAACIH